MIVNIHEMQVLSSNPFKLALQLVGLWWKPGLSLRVFRISSRTCRRKGEVGAVCAVTLDRFPFHVLSFGTEHLCLAFPDSVPLVQRPLSLIQI